LVAERQGIAISLTEISTILEINQATAANIINTLVSKDYLEHIGKKKGYRLGPACFTLTNNDAYEQNLLSASKEAMKNLTEAVQESCLLGIMRNQKRYIIHVENSNQVIQIQTRSERSMYETASGRILLAYLSEKELDRFLAANELPTDNTWEGVTDKATLMVALEKIKREKLAKTYAYGREIKGFAAPIFKNNIVIAGLSVFVPEYRCSAAKEQEIIANLLATCERININMENL
jgi:IclR family transcriptional regulator, KDG regulon repressor